jgi:hypothetical protein
MPHIPELLIMSLDAAYKAVQLRMLLPSIAVLVETASGTSKLVEGPPCGSLDAPVWMDDHDTVGFRSSRDLSLWLYSRSSDQFSNLSDCQAPLIALRPGELSLE